MANVQLKDLTFAGLSNTYIVPQNAEEFTTTDAYTAGKRVSYQGKFYKFKVDHAAGAWNSAEVDELYVGDEIETLESGLDELSDQFDAFSGAVESRTTYLDPNSDGNVQIFAMNIGGANGVPVLDSNGKVPAANLPSYVDDIIEGYYRDLDGKFYSDSGFTTEITGETGKIYLDLSNNQSYRWSGSVFVNFNDPDKEDVTNKVTAWSGTTTDVHYPSEKLVKDTIDAVEDKVNFITSESEVITGNPIEVESDIEGLPVKELKISFSPVQSGSGDPSPSNVRPITGWDSISVTKTDENLWGGAKMLADMDGANNKTYRDGDTIISVSSSSPVVYHNYYATFKENTRYTLILNYSNSEAGAGGMTRPNMVFTYTDGTNTKLGDNGGEANVVRTLAFVSDENKTIRAIRYTAAAGTATIYPYRSGLFEGVKTVNDYTPYNGVTTTIPFYTTRYGGTIDVLNGKAIIDKTFIELNGNTSVTISSHGAAEVGEDFPYYIVFYVPFSSTSNDYTKWCFSHGLCQNTTYSGIFRVSRYQETQLKFVIGTDTEYTSEADVTAYLAAQSTNGTPLQVVAALETPVEIDLTPAELSLLAGYNYIYSNSNSNITMEYGEAIARLNEKIDRLNANDIAYDSSATYTAGTVGAGIKALDTSRVPTSRTVNSKALSSDVTLSAEDLQYDSTLVSHTSGSVGEELVSQSRRIDVVSGDSKTVTGNPIEITDGIEGMPPKDLKVNFVYYRSLNGYTTAWSSKKNKMPVGKYYSDTVNGLTVTSNRGVYSFQGTSTVQTAIIFELSHGFNIPSDSTDNLLLGNNTAIGTSTNGCIKFMNGDTEINYYAFDEVERKVTSFPDIANQYCDRIKIELSAGTYDFVAKPMLCLKTEESDDFVAGANVCDINGVDSVTLTVQDAEETPTNTIVKTYQFDTTRYGGTIDVLNGKLIIDRQYYELTGDESWSRYGSTQASYMFRWTSRPNIGGALRRVCNQFSFEGITTSNTDIGWYVYNGGTSSASGGWIQFRPGMGIYTVDDWKAFLAAQYANGTPVQVTYARANPLIYDLTPEELSLFEGYNYISSSNTPETITMVYGNAIDSLNKRIDREVSRFTTGKRRDIKSECTSTYAINSAYEYSFGALTRVSVVLNNGSTGIPTSARLSKVVTLGKDYGTLMIFHTYSNAESDLSGYTLAADIPLYSLLDNGCTSFTLDVQNGIYPSNGNLPCVIIEAFFMKV